MFWRNGTREITISFNEKGNSLVVDPQTATVPSGSTVRWTVEEGVAQIIFQGPQPFTLLAQPGNPASIVTGMPSQNWYTVLYFDRVPQSPPAPQIPPQPRGTSMAVLIIYP